MRTENRREERLINGFDYKNQAWVKDGKYQSCGHPQACRCFGKKHAGEETK